MKVVDTKDSNIKELNMNENQELPTGEVSSGDIANKNITRELETGKKKPVTANLAKRPDEIESNEVTGEITNRPTRTSPSLPNPSKIVEVGIIKYVKCRIGKKWYEFHPGNNYRVAETVKEILKRNGALGVI